MVVVAFHRLVFTDAQVDAVASDTETEPVEAIVGSVDALSGVVLETRREARTRPPGG